MKYVFIMGHRKSGTTLLCSLLDNHSDIFVYPYEHHMTYSFYPEYIKKKYTKKEKIERIFNFILPDLYEILNSWCKIPQSKIDSTIKPQFENQIKAYLKGKNKLKDYFDAVWNSTINILGKENIRLLVTKDTHSEIHFNLLKNNYPNSIFINVVRNPRDVFSTLLGGWDKHYKYQYESKMDLLRDFIERGLCCYNTAFMNKNNKNYYIILYEDLIQHSEITMKLISQILSINYQNSLLKPSVLGIPWKSNSFTNDTEIKIRTNRIDIWKNIDLFYIDIIDFFFQHIYKEFNYNTGYKKSLTQSESVQKYYNWLNTKCPNYGKGFRKYG
ncbi:MAG: sulfotransferase family protein [Candidatus Helarchaeota archaeon]